MLQKCTSKKCLLYEAKVCVKERSQRILWKPNIRRRRHFIVSFTFGDATVSAFLENMFFSKKFPSNIFAITVFLSRRCRFGTHFGFWVRCRFGAWAEGSFWYRIWLGVSFWYIPTRCTGNGKQGRRRNKNNQKICQRHQCKGEERYLESLENYLLCKERKLKHI